MTTQQGNLIRKTGENANHLSNLPSAVTEVHCDLSSQLRSVYYRGPRKSRQHGSYEINSHTNGGLKTRETRENMGSIFIYGKEESNTRSLWLTDFSELFG